MTIKNAYYTLQTYIGTHKSAKIKKEDFLIIWEIHILLKEVDNNDEKRNFE